MKRFLVFFVVFLLLLLGDSCSSSKNTFYKKKYQTVKKKDYGEKRGLMLLENTQIGRNKYFYSKSNQKKIKSRKK